MTGRSGFQTGIGVVAAVLDAALAQAGDGAAVRAVDLELDELVAVDAHAPRRVDLGDDAAVELEDRVGRVVGGRLVRLAVPRPSARGTCVTASAVTARTGPNSSRST